MDTAGGWAAGENQYAGLLSGVAGLVWWQADWGSGPKGVAGRVVGGQWIFGAKNFLSERRGKGLTMPYIIGCTQAI